MRYFTAKHAATNSPDTITRARGLAEAFSHIASDIAEKIHELPSGMGAQSADYYYRDALHELYIAASVAMIAQHQRARDTEASFYALPQGE